MGDSLSYLDNVLKKNSFFRLTMQKVKRSLLLPQKLSSNKGKKMKKQQVTENLIRNGAEWPDIINIHTLLTMN